ncbi:hypothetical protein XENOCAPTIV_026449 [Xenoophorus captivus]|uniref:Uncharacterized protein n=1 Tax=Xenoophorus captivus TaxID=1517983 RepID=A0ABV0S3A4_9TELE
MTIAQQNTDRLTEDTMKDTDDWTRVANETGTGNRTEQPKAIILEISPQTCTTTDMAARESATGMTRTGGKAAGVSTNEGGVEPGPIAPLPRDDEEGHLICRSGDVLQERCTHCHYSIVTLLHMSIIIEHLHDMEVPDDDALLECSSL